MAIRTSYIKTHRADKTSTFAGSLTVDKDLTISGDMTFGDVAADTLTMYGSMAWAAVAPTYCIDMNSATPGTADIRLSNAATIHNSAAAVLDITEGTVNIVATTAFQHKYDNSNYLTSTVSSAGVCKLATTGSSDSFEIETGDGGITLDAANNITLDAGTGDVDFSNDALFATTKKCQFRDTGLYVYSSADTKLDLVADGGIFLTVPGSGYYGVVIGGETDWGTGATGPDLDGTGWDWVSQTVGRVNTANITASAYAAAYHAFTLTASQNLTSSFFGTWTELYLSANVVLTGASNVAAVWGQVETGATVTGPDQADGDFMTAGYFNFKTGDDFTTGSYVNGVRIQSEVSSTGYTETASTWMAGLEILKKSGKQDWTYGVKIANSTTSIDIGACTTGINVAANIVIPQFMTLGTITNPIHWDGVASNILIYQENTDTTPASITANKFSLSAAQSAATTSGRLECFRAEVKSYSTNAVTADMRALVGQVEFSGDMTYIGSSANDFAGAYGVIASIWSASNVTANSGNLGKLYPLGIFFGLETGTSLSGEDAYIYIYNYGKVCPNSVIKLYNASTPEVPTYLFDHQGAVLGSSSGPVYTGSLDDSSTADILCDGHIKILVGATPYYIPIYDTLA